MIALIRACIKFEKIIANIPDPNLSSALFHFLSTIGQISNDPELFEESIKSAMQTAIDNNDINNPDNNYQDIVKHQDKIKQMIIAAFQNQEICPELITLISMIFLEYRAFLKFLLNLVENQRYLLHLYMEA